MRRSRKSVVLLLLAALASRISGEADRPKILSFGGNGMIGSEVLSRLLARGPHDITVVSRGNWPFDSAERVRPHVKAVKCDRAKDAECAGLPGGQGASHPLARGSGFSGTLCLIAAGKSGIASPHFSSSGSNGASDLLKTASLEDTPAREGNWGV